MNVAAPLQPEMDN